MPKETPLSRFPYQPLATSGEAVQVAVPAPEDTRFSHLGWPKLVKTPKGTLVLGCIAGRMHVAAGCPAVAVSTDGGKSFSALTILKEFDASMTFKHCGNISLGIAEDGAIVLLAMAFTGDVCNTIYGWRSEDEARSWQAVDCANLAGNKTGSVYGEIFPIPGVGLVTFGHYRKGARPHDTGIWFAVSQTQGRSWGSAQMITQSKFFEPSFTFSSGRIVGLIRDDPAGYYQQMVSDDLGETWEENVSRVGVGQRGLPSPFVTVDPNDSQRLLALLTKRGHNEEELGFIDVWEANVEKLDWRRIRQLISIPHPPSAEPPVRADYGYPWMTFLGGNRWLLVFYAGHFAGPNSIFSLEVEL